MANYQIQNTSEKAIRFTLVSSNESGLISKEDIVLYPGDIREIAKLANAHVDFHAPVDFTFRQKKSLTNKINFIKKTHKELKEKVTSVDLPEVFTLLKIKEVHA